MSETIRDGYVTLRIDARFDDIVRRIEDAVQGATVRETYAMVALVADDAASSWYRQVDKRTGDSGTVRAAWREKGTRLHFEIGNDDSRKDPKSGKPALFFIHRPGPFSKKRRAATPSEQDAIFKRDGRYAKYVLYPNPKASDGAYLLSELIKKPANAGRRKLTARLARTIVAAIERKQGRERGGS